MDVRKYEVIEEVDLGDIILKPGAQVEIEFLDNCWPRCFGYDIAFEDEEFDNFFKEVTE